MKVAFHYTHQRPHRTKRWSAAGTLQHKSTSAENNIIGTRWKMLNADIRLFNHDTATEKLRVVPQRHISWVPTGPSGVLTQ